MTSKTTAMTLPPTAIDPLVSSHHVPHALYNLALSPMRWNLSHLAEDMGLAFVDCPVAGHTWGVNVDHEPRSGIVEWFREVGDPWMLKGRVDRRPKPGSDLAADEAGGLKPSVAHHGVVIALDHLGSVIDAMVSDESMRHYAHFSTLRTVLLASARVRWMLESDSSQIRQIRCLQTEYVNLVEQRKAFRTMASTAANGALKRQACEILAGFEAPMSELEVRATALGMAELVPPPDTLSVLQQLVKANTTEGFVALQLWRMGSSTAHGYYWSDTQRPDPHLFDDDMFDMALQGATLFVREAMGLYDQRAAGRQS